VRARLEAALSETGHAYLFSGAPGYGATAYARRFAALLLGLDEHALAGHPDLGEIEPEGTQLRIEQVRELWHDVHMRPFAADRRVYLVHGADAMTETTQHALLKSLEEAPAYAVVVLLTARPHMLLATVRSRCQLVPFPPLSAHELGRLLELDGVAADEARALAREARGDLDAARALAAHGGPAERHELYLELARGAYRDPAFDPGAAAGVVDRAGAARGAEEAAAVTAAASEQLARLGGDAAAARERRRVERDADALARRRRRAAQVAELQSAVDAAASWYRDLLATAVGAESSLIHSRRRQALQEDVQAGAGAFAGEALDVARDVRRSLELTITPVLAAEGLYHRVWLLARNRRREGSSSTEPA
jgi:DNA polymerase-3 subunit delta'